jgi:hypothetical protein
MLAGFKMKTLKVFFLTLFISVIAAIISRPALANEGKIELDSTIGDNTRCFFLSGLMKDANYNLLGICRNLTYPPNSQSLFYIVWARPVDGKDPIRLGSLDVGKFQGRIDRAFSELFVTKELKADVRTPSSSVVMRGRVQSIAFLQGQAPNVTVSPEPTPEEIQTPQTTPATKFKLKLPSLKTGALPAIILVAVILFVIFLIRRGGGA